jgi:hypothetical protein
MTNKFYGDGSFSKGKTVHKTKKSANKVAKSAKIVGISYKIKKVKGGWRVDKRY